MLHSRNIIKHIGADSGPNGVERMSVDPIVSRHKYVYLQN